MRTYVKVNDPSGEAPGEPKFVNGAKTIVKEKNNDLELSLTYLLHSSYERNRLKNTADQKSSHYRVLGWYLVVKRRPFLRYRDGARIVQHHCLLSSCDDGIQN